MSRFLISTLAIGLLSACHKHQPPEADVSEVPSSTLASQTMVVTANPLATDAGVAVLEAGGSAVDAAIAIQAVLTLVEPQSSGLGGSGFMLHYDSNSKNIDVYDGRETAPAGAHAEMFLRDDESAMSFLDAKTSGLSIGVPGMVSLLGLAHTDHGVLSWADLFAPAIRLSEEGFDVSPRLKNSLLRFEEYIPSIAEDGPTDAYEYFFESEGAPKSRITNADYANSLKQIAANPRAFYEGQIAVEIAEQASISPRAGTLTIQDMAAYSARKLEPLCTNYKTYELCGPPPPSSWVAVGMVMGMLATAPRFYDEPGYQDWAIFAEALRLAYADRDQYVADDAFIDVPLNGMLHPEYLKSRAALIRAESTSELTAGDPWTFEDRSAHIYGLDSSEDAAGTTHFAVVDAEGNAVSMTASVESFFGSTRMAGGMILNNQLTDFARNPRDEEGELLANAAAPGKRPRSSMSPTIVLDENGDFYLSSGSPGGNSIISYTLKTLVAVLDWGLTPQEAVDLPNMVARGDQVRIEKSRASEELISTLSSYGFNVQESAGEGSGLGMIMRQQDGTLIGGADPRRESTIGVPTTSAAVTNED